MNTQLGSWRHRLPFFYGWIIVFAAGWSSLFTGPGQTYSYSIFIDHFVRDFGWSRTLVSTMYSAATLVSGLLMSVVGSMVDRLGARVMCVAAGLLLAAACLWTSLVISPFMLLIGFFLGRFSGQGTLAISAATLAPRWFVRSRGLAIMLAGLGGTASGILFPVVNTYLVQSFGWRDAFRILGAGLLLLYVPVAAILIISRPEKIGMQPYGSLSADEKTGVSANPSDEVSFTRLQALRTPAFWILALVFFQYALVGTGTSLHFLSIFAERGYSATYAATMMSIKPGLGLGATILLGLFMDRVKRPQYILSTVSAMNCIGYFLLIYLSGTILPYAYTVIAGLSGMPMVYMIRVMPPFLFGREHIGAISGLMSVIILAGSALGPLPFGVAYDFFGGYAEILWISALMPAVALVAAALIRRPSPPAAG